MSADVIDSIRGWGRLQAGLATALATAVLGCGPSGAGAAGPGAPTSSPADAADQSTPPHGAAGLFLDPSNARIATNPRLLARLKGSAHDYFRFVNVQFSERVCKAFASSMAVMPNVNLHGDAHLEQYAVTADDYGLYDFDDASTGPAILDLVRLATSIRLTAFQHQWPQSDADEAIATFLDAYRTALDDPQHEFPTPSFVGRMRQDRPVNRGSFLAHADALMHALSDDSKRQFESGFARYKKLLLEREGETPRAPTFFTIKRMGTAHSGIGSALDQRFLVRVEGPSPSDDDDVILEAKETRDLVGISCVQTTATRSPFRVLLGQSRIGSRQDPFLAAVPPGPDETADDVPFWVQSWDASYQEVRVMKTITSREDFLALVRDIGGQLGRGHIKGIAAPYDADLRSAQRALLDRHRARIRSTAAELERETLAAWRAFRGDG